MANLLVKLDGLPIVACINWGEWRGDVLFGMKLHNSVIQHHPQCNGNCDATHSVERLREEGRLIGKPRHKLRAATN